MKVNMESGFDYKRKLFRGLPHQPEKYSMAIGDYDVEIKEIDKDIAILEDALRKGHGRDYPAHYILKKYKFRVGSSFSIGINREINMLKAKRRSLVEELAKEEQAIKDLELKKQKAITDAAKAEVDRKLAEVEEAKNKSEQELAKAQQELARAQAAQRLAESGKSDDAARLLGQEVKSYKGLIIGGIILVTLAAGFGVYKLLTRKK